MFLLKLIFAVFVSKLFGVFKFFVLVSLLFLVGSILCSKRAGDVVDSVSGLVSFAVSLV